VRAKFKHTVGDGRIGYISRREPNTAGGRRRRKKRKKKQAAGLDHCSFVLYIRGGGHYSFAVNATVCWISETEGRV